MGCHRAQEAVTPEERGVFADPTAPRGLADSQSFDECLRVVFPALGFAQPGTGQREHRANGLAYTAGVVLSFLALGGLMLALRAGVSAAKAAK